MVLLEGTRVVYFPIIYFFFFCIVLTFTVIIPVLVSFFYITEHPNMTLMQACDTYDEALFNNLLDTLDGDVLKKQMNERDEEQNTPLHCLCFCEVDTPEEKAICLRMIKRLAAAGAGLNDVNEDDLTPLRVAVSNYRFDIIKLLIECGCGTGPEHIWFYQVFSDSMDPWIYKQDWKMWTMISGERPTEAYDGCDFEPGYFDGWPEQVLPIR